MARINNTAAYAISSPVTADDIVIGSEGGNGGDTKNFQMSDILTYIMSSSTLTLQDVCDNGSATTTGITVAGATTLNGALDLNSTADISGNTTIGGTLGVTGVSTLGEIDSAGPADIADTLTLSKASGQALAVSAGSVYFASDLDVFGLHHQWGALTVEGITTLNMALYANSTADIADTLTLSKASGTGLSLPSSSISVGGSTIVSSTAVTADNFQTNTASFTATPTAVQCSVAATFSAFDSTLGGTTTVSGVLDANSTADIADTLTLSKASGGSVNGTNGLALLSNGFTRLNIASTGEMTFLQQAQFTQKVIFSQSVPSSSTDTGTAGQIAVDATYIYVCVGTNSWGRVAIDTTPF